VQPIQTSLANGVYTITLNRPAVLNAFTLEMLTMLREAVEQAADDSVRVLVLRGAGGNFCSGADLSVLSGMKSAAEADEALIGINRMLTCLHRLPKPTIALIEGAAVGAGLNLALHTDFVLALRDAVLQEPFVHIGLTTDFGGTFLLPRLLGMAQAKRLALLGERITGEEAERIGLIYRSYATREEMETAAESLITRLLAIPAHAYAVTKEGLTDGVTMSHEECLEWEKQQQPRLISHPAFRELVAARQNRSK
jgi:2-(1,2-epoxy-1,2-dihydrophenyl)acetyl-CoA isomerase